MNTNLPESVVEFLGYMKARNKSIKTIEGYEIDLKMLFQYLRFKKELSKTMKIDNIGIIDVTNIDDVFIGKITISDLNSFVSYLDVERKNGAATKARKVNCIRSFYNYLFKNDIIKNNVGFKLENIDVPKREPVYLTLDQTKKLTEATRDNEECNIRDITIIMLFLNTGIRLSELVNLDINNINFEYKTITVIGKGNKQRTLTLNENTIEILKEYLEYRKTIEDKIIKEDINAVFINKNYGRMGERGIQKLSKKYFGNAGLDPDKYSVHKLRHTAATLLYKHGKVDIRTLQKILGHSSLNTTQIYTHVDDEQIQNAMNSMPNF
jgi:site-specific recombinase XerD